MNFYELNTIEMRVIGSLIEKAITTPEYYPLSLNSLQSACNQKSNRDPVMTLSESTIAQALDVLVARGLVIEVTGSHSRVSKYQHRFCNSEFSDLQFNNGQTAILCMLFLRGAQTPGELRSRSGRLYDFHDLDEVETALTELQKMQGGPFVTLLPKQAGKREQRYQECFGSHQDQQLVARDEDNALQIEEESLILAARVNELEAQVAQIIDRIQKLENGGGL
ncbi:YceH family protein [Marinomonas sp. THO17]|uniref:YceH family protein n=1 Tax=Marinomonas sp. THO17 TaxID=3149048 RepID=UPI00336C30C4